MMVMMKRDGTQRAIYYTIAYGGGPRKLSRYDTADLVEARRRWQQVAIHKIVDARLDVIERALQTRVDEEGCGALIAAVKYDMHRHTTSVDTNASCHGDLGSDAGGDAVPFGSVGNQQVSLGARDLGSGGEIHGSSSLPTRTSPKATHNYPF